MRSSMRIPDWRPAFLIALSLTSFCSSNVVAAPSPMPAPTSAGGLFQDKPFGPLPPPTATPPIKIRDLEDPKPIPFGWYVGGGVLAAVTVMLLLWGAARAWRSSNLFDRQYYFPTDPEPALRLNAVRCGGHMATIDLGPPDVPPPSETKDT